MSNHISLVRGVSETFEVALVDGNNEPLALADLVDATAEFLLRVLPEDVSNILRFTTTDNPTSLSFKANEAGVALSFTSNNTAALALGVYFYQLQVTRSNGDVLNVIPWSMFELNLGGAATTPLAPFDNTVKIDHDYQLPDDLAYMTPGGTPIADAQVRLYYKSDYIAGRLEAPIGITMTNANGRWMTPILVVPGNVFIVRFEKPGEWGPNTQEIFA
jgi:hypothetical protein